MFTRDIERVIFTKGTVSCGNFAGISSAFRRSAVTNATGVPRAVLVRSLDQSLRNVQKITRNFVNPLHEEILKFLEGLAVPNDEKTTASAPPSRPATSPKVGEFYAPGASDCCSVAIRIQLQPIRTSCGFGAPLASKDHHVNVGTGPKAVPHANWKVFPGVPEGPSLRSVVG